MAKIAHIYGALRSAELATKSGTNEVWGCRGTILSEPEGDTFDVVAFSRVIDPQTFLHLKGQDVHAIVEVDVTAGSRGGAFLNVSIRSIEPRVPVVVAIPSPTAEDAAA